MVSIGELQLGVLAAPDPGTRSRRADKLALARAADPLPISEAVMSSWARLVADCRAADVHRLVKLTDALIAATAIEHGLAVITQDDDLRPDGPERMLPCRSSKCEMRMGSHAHAGSVPSCACSAGLSRKVRAWSKRL